MTTEPDYIAQTAEPEHTDTMRARHSWLDARIAEYREEGCVHARASWSKDNDMLLIEAWKVRPDDEGAPRWQLTHGEPHHD